MITLAAVDEMTDGMMAVAADEMTDGMMAVVAENTNIRSVGT